MHRLLSPIQAIWPLALLILSLYASQFIDKLPLNWQNLISQILPSLLLASAAFLSIKFNRSRFLQALAIVFFIYVLPQYDALAKQLPFSLSIAISAILLFMLSFSKDRQLLSIHGLIRLIVASLGLALIYLLHNHFSLQSQNLLNATIIQLPLSFNQYLPSSQVISAVTLGFMIIHALCHFFTNNTTHSKFVAFQLALALLASPQASPLFIAIILSSLSIVVILSVILDSHDMAYRDELTALPSRRALNQLLLSLGRKYTIAMMDIDHFKKFNDTHGHDVGDEVLRMVASKIARVTGGGKPFRYGGEEFTVVFPGKSPDQVEAHLDALRQVIGNYQMTVRAQKRSKDDKKGKDKRGKSKALNSGKLSVTISIGLAERQGSIKTPQQVLKAADEALYRAKKAGRNCVSR